MATRSRYYYVICLVAGFFITLWSITALSSSGDRTPLGHIVQIAFGVALMASGGYAFLYPQKANSPTVMLFSAGTGFVLTAVVLFSLLHIYGNTGVFSTGDSRTGLGAIAFLLIVSVWLLFYSRSLRNKGQN